MDDTADTCGWITRFLVCPCFSILHRLARSTDASRVERGWRSVSWTLVLLGIWVQAERTADLQTVLSPLQTLQLGGCWTALVFQRRYVRDHEVYILLSAQRQWRCCWRCHGNRRRVRSQCRNASNSDFRVRLCATQGIICLRGQQRERGSPLELRIFLIVDNDWLALAFGRWGCGYAGGSCRGGRTGLLGGSCCRGSWLCTVFGSSEGLCRCGTGGLDSPLRASRRLFHQYYIIIIVFWGLGQVWCCLWLFCRWSLLCFGCGFQMSFPLFLPNICSGFQISIHRSGNHLLTQTQRGQQLPEQAKKESWMMNRKENRLVDQ